MVLLHHNFTKIFFQLNQNNNNIIEKKDLTIGIAHKEAVNQLNHLGLAKYKDEEKLSDHFAKNGFNLYERFEKLGFDFKQLIKETKEEVKLDFLSNLGYLGMSIGTLISLISLISAPVLAGSHPIQILIALASSLGLIGVSSFLPLIYKAKMKKKTTYNKFNKYVQDILKEHKNGKLSEAIKNPNFKDTKLSEFDLTPKNKNEPQNENKETTESPYEDIISIEQIFEMKKHPVSLKK